jgi:glycosyltransferase involved in cell wall biosynthesis
MNEPLVSVVIATWNTGRYLPETLASALAQTYLRREIIVVDDGSTDDTVARIEPFRSAIRYIRQEHQGLAAARNAGIAAAQGEFIALLDADDLWSPEKLALQVAVAGRNPGSGLIACGGVEFAGEQVLRPLMVGSVGRLLHDDAGHEVSGWFHREFLEANAISCPAQTLIPRRVLDEIGPFIDSGAQDYDCYLRIAQRFPITFHGDSLVRWRYRPDSMSGPRDERTRVWGWMMLGVLLGHARRCTAQERRLISRRLVPVIQDLAYSAYIRGTEGDRSDAGRDLAKLLRARPWPPTALPYLIGLLAPPPVRKWVARLRRLVTRISA